MHPASACRRTARPGCLFCQGVSAAPKESEPHPGLRPEASLVWQSVEAWSHPLGMRQALTYLQAHFKGSAQRPLAVGRRLDPIADALQTMQPEIVFFSLRKGGVSGSNAFPAVRRGKDLYIKARRRLGQGSPHLFEDRVVKPVFDLINQYDPVPRSGDFHQDGGKTPQPITQ